MKRMIVLIIVLLVILALSGCRGIDTGKVQVDASSPATEMEIPTMTATTQATELGDKAGPSEVMIKKDLEESIKGVNSYATIIDLKTIKSLTNEGHYEATMSVWAETKYATWEFKAEITYTKYDQGWIIDEADWVDHQYVLVRTPDVETMISIANQLGEDMPYYHEVLPIETGTIDAGSTLETGKLYFEFEKVKKLKHAEESKKYVLPWSYDADTDGWVLDDDDEGIAYTASVTPYDVDLSGDWDGVSIRNFSWDGFDLSMDSNFDGNINTHFFRITGHPQRSDEEFGWYSDGNGYYCQIDCDLDGSSMMVCSFGRSLVVHAYVSINK